MTAIHQNTISNNHSIGEQSHQSSKGNEKGHKREGSAENNSTQSVQSSTVNISFNAELRLRAYQEQRKLVEPNQSEAIALNSEIKALSIESTVEKSMGMMRENDGNSNVFSQNINYMLDEVQNNIVKKSEPGYQYLVNVLNNNKNTVEDPQQLQEIMRKEQFYLSRRKPFMPNSDFQSYSQVLSQFSNIVGRQQYANQSNI